MTLMEHPNNTRISGRIKPVPKALQHLIQNIFNRELYVDLSQARIDLENYISQEAKFKPVTDICMDCSIDPPMCNVKKYLPWILFTTICMMLVWQNVNNQAFLKYSGSFDLVKNELFIIKDQMIQLKKEMDSTKMSVLKELKESQRTIDNDGETGKEVTIDGLKSEDVRVAIKKALEEQNKYDKTGKVDFALETAGGRIVGVRNTEPFNPEASFLSRTFFGIPLCEVCKGPRAIIQPNSLPGDCWAFKGTSGSTVIQLLGFVFIDSVSLEHISKSISPSGKIDTAPREFSIWGLRKGCDKQGTPLGRFTYRNDGPPIQTFPITKPLKSYRFIEFKVHSNHGSKQFTCVYRVRIHGRLDESGISDDEDLP